MIESEPTERYDERTPEEQSPKPKWEKPTLEEEQAEIERTAEHLGIATSILFDAYETAELEELSDEDWSILDNADSSSTDWTTEDARYKCEQEYGRDFKRIEDGLKSGHTFPAPLVLFQENQGPYLIGGNSRLLGCRVLGLRPTVLALRIDNIDQRKEK